jgi:hypothetical protein
VISDNLFGLEIDPRCTQIAAFNLALAAWRRVGYCVLPPMNLACSGLAPNTTEEEWLKLADGNEKLENGMASLYHLFENAPVLGSLINPRTSQADLLEAGFHELQPLLEKAMAAETKDDTSHEMAVTARGLAKAAEILAGQFTLVATNVPYLGRGKQHETLQNYCQRIYPESKTDLATCFVERCLAFCTLFGGTALVTPQNWLSLPSYSRMRSDLLRTRSVEWFVRLGAKAFETIGGEVVNVALVAMVNTKPTEGAYSGGCETESAETPVGKGQALKSSIWRRVVQSQILKNPDARITLEAQSNLSLLSSFAFSPQGIKTGDDGRYRRTFWEIPIASRAWRFYQGSPDKTQFADGMHFVIDWSCEGAGFSRLQGMAAWGKRGVVLKLMGDFTESLFHGEQFDSNVTAIIPNDVRHLPALWCFCASPEFSSTLKSIEAGIKVNNATAVKIPFDLAHWQKVAADEYPHGLPKPFSSDPTQWLFNGHPKDSDTPLQVAVARLCGYEWPRQTGSSFPDCPALIPDGLESLADKDGIVCIPPVRGEASAADRFLNLLAKAYGQSWSSDVLPGLLKDAGFASKSLETWLRDGFFLQHCELFHQRPFIWHIWDGLRDGFSALINYHKLDRKNLETLIYTYLGDWMTRQTQDLANGVDGAQEKLSAAEQLKKRLELILAGEAPYDIFVRWKPLHQQPIGWEPDINNGVRMNIRPFLSVPDVKGKGAGILRVKPKIKWEKDRGKEPQRSKEEYPWFWGWDEKTVDFTGGFEFKGERFNDCHYTLAFKRNAREAHQ